MVPWGSCLSASPGSGVSDVEVTVGGWDLVHGRRNGTRRVSVGVLEPWAGLRPFDRVHETERAGGSSDFRDALVLQFGTVAARDGVLLSRNQKPCACT